MGCVNLAPKKKRIIQRADLSRKNVPKHFTIYIDNPQTSERQEFTFKTDEDELPLTTVMNSLAFDLFMGEKFDSNFVSI